MFDIIKSWFSVETVFFTFLEYPMSYIEFVGTILYLASVWLIARRNMLTWPVGIISVILYAILFYQIRLYADAIEQVYYLGASIYGWWYWKQSLLTREKELVVVEVTSPKAVVICASCTLAASVLLSFLMARIHEILPKLFPEPASYPFWDTLTTVMSFVAMFLLARKKLESWVYWIIVDIIGIWLYYVKNVKFISLLYVILLVMAANGLAKWLKQRKRQAESGNDGTVE